MSEKPEKSNDFGLILAGGAGRRFGCIEKGALKLGGETLYARAIARLSPQCAAVAISANGDPARLAGYGLPVLPDALPDCGPLGGVLSGLVWAREAGASHLVSVAVDTPFFPMDLVERLAVAECAQAASPSGLHPVFARWPVSLADNLLDFLKNGGRKVTAFTDNVSPERISFQNQIYDPFLNINRPEDLIRATERLAP
ncbi:molybdenum cofactor guanylyltransferase MobA [Paracoccaceae bacterium GXU_MW_L88]